MSQCRIPKTFAFNPYDLSVESKPSMPSTTMEWFSFLQHLQPDFEQSLAEP
jgi:hypothetical protein